jgi:hypothetical protein
MPERKSPSQSATLYKIGTKKKGNDNNIWIITENKNGVKKWILYKKSTDKSSTKIKTMSNPNDYFKQFSDYKKPINDISFFTKEIKSLQNEFKKIGVLFFFLKWGETSLLSGGHHSYILSLIRDKTNMYPNGHIYTSDLLLYYNSIQKDGKINLYHRVDEKIINNVNKILISYFPKRTLCIQNNRDAIIIYFEKKNKIKKIKEYIKWQISYIFEDKKIVQTDDELGNTLNFILSKIDKKFIHRIDDAFNFQGSTILFLSIYNDNLNEFVNIIKKLKILLIPKIKKIIIKEGDKIILNKKWIFEY